MKIQTEDRRKMYLEPTYPYAYARVCAMKSKLVRRDDYTKLLKMGVNEVMKFLQETEYKKEIDELSMAISGVNLVELALNKNLIKTMQKLKRISPDELRLLIEAYLKRMDSHNIKTILRGKLTKAGNEYVETLLVPVGKIKKEELLNIEYPVIFFVKGTAPIRSPMKKKIEPISFLFIPLPSYLSINT